MQRIRKEFVTVLVVAMAASLLALMGVLGYVHERYPIDSGELTPLHFTGECRTDGGDWVPIEDAVYNLREYHTYEFCGHFDSEIPAREQVLLRINDLETHISVNGDEVFSFGYPGKNSAGNVWASFVSPGITPEDTVEISLRNAYVGVHMDGIDQFFGELYGGYSGSLYPKQIHENAGALQISLILISLGMLEFAIACGLWRVPNADKLRRQILYCSCFAIASGVWFFIAFDVVSLLVPMPRLINSLNLYSGYLMVAFAILFVFEQSAGAIHRAEGVLAAISIGNVLVAVVLELFWGIDPYRTSLWGWPLILLLAALALGCHVAEWARTRSKYIGISILAVVPLLLSSVVDTVLSKTGQQNGIEWMQYGALAYIFAQFLLAMSEFQKKMQEAERAERLQKEMERAKTSVMLSQIQPHFLYNALSSIRALCAIAPEEAESAVIHFSQYLRGNLQAVTMETMIPMSRELEHIENYLYLEQLRFQDKLTVQRDLQALDFSVPPLSIQPLVENAVRYGVSQKQEPGTVWLSSWEDAKFWYIRVKDDGVGYDPLATQYDGRTRLGLDETRSRLKILCGGTMRIHFKPGAGTTIEVRIPKGGHI